MDKVLVEPNLLLMMMDEPGFDMVNIWFTEYNPLPSLSEMGFIKTNDGEWKHKSLKIGAKSRHHVSQKTSKDWTNCDIEHYDQSEDIIFLYQTDNPERIIAALVYQPTENQALLISEDVRKNHSLIETMDRLLKNGREI